MRGPKTVQKNYKRRERRMKAIQKFRRNDKRRCRYKVSTVILFVCAYFLSLSQSLTLIVIPILSLLTFVDCCFAGSCLYLSLVVTRRRSSSLVVTRHSLSTRHLIVSLMRAHTHTLSLLSLSLSCWLSLLLMAFSFIALRPPSPSISLLVSLHLTLFSLRSLPTTIY